jgi:hypothetical protein
MQLERPASSRTGLRPRARASARARERGRGRTQVLRWRRKLKANKNMNTAYSEKKKMVLYLKNIFPVVFHADYLPAPFTGELKPFIQSSHSGFITIGVLADGIVVAIQ